MPSMEDENVVRPVELDKKKRPSLEELKALQLEHEEQKAREHQEKLQREEDEKNLAEKFKQSLDQHWQLSRQLLPLKERINALELSGVVSKRANMDSYRQKAEQLQSVEAELAAKAQELSDEVAQIRVLTEGKSEELIAPQIKEHYESLTTDIQSIDSQLTSMRSEIEQINQSLSAIEDVEEYDRLQGEAAAIHAQISKLESDESVKEQLDKEKQEEQQRYEQLAGDFLKLRYQRYPRKRGAASDAEHEIGYKFLVEYVREIVEAQGVDAADTREDRKKRVVSATALVQQGLELRRHDGGNYTGYQGLKNKLSSPEFKGDDLVIAESYSLANKIVFGTSAGSILKDLKPVEAAAWRYMKIMNEVSRQVEHWNSTYRGDEKDRRLNIQHWAYVHRKEIEKDPSYTVSDQEVTSGIVSRHLGSFNTLRALRLGMEGIVLASSEDRSEDYDFQNALRRAGFAADRETGALVPIDDMRLEEKRRIIEKFSHELKIAAARSLELIGAELTSVDEGIRSKQTDLEGHLKIVEKFAEARRAHESNTPVIKLETENRKLSEQNKHYRLKSDIENLESQISRLNPVTKFLKERDIAAKLDMTRRHFAETEAQIKLIEQRLQEMAEAEAVVRETGFDYSERITVMRGLEQQIQELIAKKQNLEAIAERKSKILSS